jgi:hypothetical protein
MRIAIKTDELPKIEFDKIKSEFSLVSLDIMEYHSGNKDANTQLEEHIFSLTIKRRNNCLST